MGDTSARLAQLSALIERIYEGALDLSVWQEMPRHIADWLDAPICTLFTPLHRPEQGGFMSAHRLSAEAMALWGSKYLAHDLWARRGQQRGLGLTGQVLRDQDLVEEEEFVQSLIYREFFAPMDVGRLLSAVVFGADDAQQHLPVLCSCNRPLRHPFTEDEAFRLRLLVPHLSRALGVVFRLRAADFKLASHLAALDLLAQGVILFDGQGRVFHANSAARHCCEPGDGLTLRAQAGQRDRLEASDPAAQAALEQAIRDALGDGLDGCVRHFSTALRLPRPSGQKGNWALAFSRLPPGNEFGRGQGDAPRAIVFISKADGSPAPDLAVLGARFGLTPAELRVLARAVDGGSVGEVAAALGLSANSVKTHLQRLYEKTGTAGRAALLRLLLSAAAPPARTDGAGSEDLASCCSPRGRGG